MARGDWRYRRHWLFLWHCSSFWSSKFASPLSKIHRWAQVCHVIQGCIAHLELSWWFLDLRTTFSSSTLPEFAWCYTENVRWAWFRNQPWKNSLTKHELDPSWDWITLTCSGIMHWTSSTNWNFTHVVLSNNCNLWLKSFNLLVLSATREGPFFAAWSTSSPRPHTLLITSA